MSERMSRREMRKAGLLKAKREAEERERATLANEPDTAEASDNAPAGPARATIDRPDDEPTYEEAQSSRPGADREAELGETAETEAPAPVGAESPARASRTTEARHRRALSGRASSTDSPPRTIPSPAQLSALSSPPRAPKEQSSQNRLSRRTARQATRITQVHSGPGSSRSRPSRMGWSMMISTSRSRAGGRPSFCSSSSSLSASASASSSAP